VETLLLLVESGAHIDRENEPGETALMKACAGGQKEAIVVLAQNGGRVAYETAKGRTCMSEASIAGHLDVMALLQVCGPLPQSRIVRTSTGARLIIWSGQQENKKRPSAATSISWRCCRWARLGFRVWVWGFTGTHPIKLSGKERETLKGGLRCSSPRWAAGRNRSRAVMRKASGNKAGKINNKFTSRVLSLTDCVTGIPQASVNCYFREIILSDGHLYYLSGISFRTPKQLLKSGRPSTDLLIRLGVRSAHSL
jgi:hypothetical protein